MNVCIVILDVVVYNVVSQYYKEAAGVEDKQYENGTAMYIDYDTDQKTNMANAYNFSIGETYFYKRMWDEDGRKK